jgi:hypothetical protein
LVRHYASVITDQTPADALEEMIAGFPLAIIQMHGIRLQRMGLI